ncbi:MAG: glutamate-1-semialdehyde 2,1-aminomutase [Clostridiales bacterium]|nr:glutamate-1-semialdehyde 2,1-aminomutase [Clostridiales bacterium]
MKTTTSETLFERAKKVLPGGVNSPVRAFNAVSGQPRFIRSGKGAYLTDADGNQYLDYICSWGPMLLGHGNELVREEVERACREGLSFGAATEREVQMAETMCSLVPSLEMLRMVNSGTEAVMSALRLARGATGREKVIKFIGCYHGHCDSMLVKAGSGLLTNGAPDSAGVTAGAAKDTLLAAYNDLSSVSSLFDEFSGQIAAVIVEPAAANMGLVLPKDGFLQGLRDLCTKNGALLIFDEVITGFRLSSGGAAEYYGVLPDIYAYGKIIGGGMPVGAYGGSRKLMENISPLGKVYQAGTLSGNPVAMAAGLSMLRQIKADPDIYKDMEKKAARLAAGLRQAFPQFTVNQEGSLLSLFFTNEPVKDFDSAKKSDTALYGKYFNHMLDAGIYLAPAQFEAMFISACHTDEDIDKTIEAARAFAKNLPQ